MRTGFVVLTRAGTSESGVTTIARDVSSIACLGALSEYGERLNALSNVFQFLSTKSEI